MNESLPMLEGLRSTWQGVGTVLPTAVPTEARELPLQDRVEAVSRSLLDAIKFAPTQAPPKPEPRPVWLAGEGSSLPVALQGELTERCRDWVFDASVPDERNPLWLMLAAVAAFPLYGPLCLPLDEERQNRG